MERQRLARIIVAAILLAGAAAVEHCCRMAVWQLLAIYLVPYLIVGYDVLIEAGESLLKGRTMDEDFLMSVATIGAFCLGLLPGGQTEFVEAVAVMLLFQVGELFEGYAEDKSRRSIASLMDIRPDTAHVERDGITTTVAPGDVAIGETIVVRPGEKIPLDGTVTEGLSSIDTAALTGESMPRDVEEGDDVVSGCVNISGMIKVKVRSTLAESTASKIIRLVESACEKKSRSEAFITRFAKIYTPIVVWAAVATVAVPALWSLLTGDRVAIADWLSRACVFLVVSCPCALVISVPLTFFAGIGGASHRGILVKGACYMDALARARTVVVDKTGTLTKGHFEVVAVHPARYDERQLLHLAAHVERYSTHPIAISLKEAFPNEDDGCRVEDVEDVAGQGVRARVNGSIVCVGNEKMMDAVCAQWHPCHLVGTIVHVAVEGEYIGHIVISDLLKDDAKEAISLLKRMGVEDTVMLTGDAEAVAAQVAAETGVDKWQAAMLPEDKVGAMRRLMAQKAEGTSLVFVGDGINDAPALAIADVGVAMGALGSDAAIEAADVVIMDDSPSKVAEAIGISRRTIHIAKENIAMALIVKLAVLTLALFGLATMWMAVFADVGVCVIAVLNAMRARNTNTIKL